MIAAKVIGLGFEIITKLDSQCQNNGIFTEKLMGLAKPIEPMVTAALISFISLNCKIQLQDRKITHAKLVCGNAVEPKLVNASVISECPKHCTRELDDHFNENNIEINEASGKLTIKNLQNIESLQVPFASQLIHNIG